VIFSPFFNNVFAVRFDELAVFVNHVFRDVSTNIDLGQNAAAFEASDPGFDIVKLSYRRGFCNKWAWNWIPSAQKSEV
jgi:hypothetical protein